MPSIPGRTSGCFAGQIEPIESEESSIRLLPYLSSDDWDIQLLYANTAPRLVQLVEPLPPTDERQGLGIKR